MSKEQTEEALMTLTKPITITRIEAIKLLVFVAGLGSIVALLSSTVGVVVGIAGAVTLAIDLYNRVIGEKINESKTKTTKNN